MHAIVGDPGQSVWVDVEWVADDVFDNPPDVVAPGFVCDMIRSARCLGPGGEALTCDPIPLDTDGAAALLEEIFRPNRKLPIVVFNASDSWNDPGVERALRQVARNLAALTTIYTLSPVAATKLQATLGMLNLEVGEGQCRVYLPIVDPSARRPDRHPIEPMHKSVDVTTDISRRLAVHVATPLVAQRPPELYLNVGRQLLDGTTRGLAEWVEFGEEQEARVGELGRELDRALEALEVTDEEALQAERENEDLRRRLEALRAQVRSLGIAAENVELAVEEEVQVTTCSQAIELARSRLTGVVIHPDAPREIRRLDNVRHPELSARRMWRYLQALDAYALDAAKWPGFHIWCSRSGSPRALPTRFVAMRESETVLNDSEMHEARRLPVDPVANPSSSPRILMEAHLKVIEGGGFQIPRIYFHDDTKGRTGKVHVGFIGPHELMPNTKSS